LVPIFMIIRRFAKLRKATITFTVFVCLSVRYTSAHTGRIFLTFYNGGRGGLFEVCRENSSLVKSDKKLAKKTKADINL